MGTPEKLSRSARRAIPGIALAIGVCVGWLVKDFFAAESRAGGLEIHEQSHYSFINPLLECEVDAGESDAKTMLQLEKRIESIIENKRESGRVSRVSVYFRDLKQGHWYGINELDVFEPASLVKVPLMMLYFKIAERHPGLLREELAFQGVHDLNRSRAFNSSENIVPGRVYTVEELIHNMIVHSDNNAYSLLRRKLDPRLLDKMLAELGISAKYLEGEDRMPLKAYAAFFRVLYNATYLNRDYSEKALSILKDVTFSEGIEAGLPPGTKFANKFGERSTGTDAPVRQLHDCGIVYHPQHPYLLCIMTRGSDFQSLKDTLREISRAAYEEVGHGSFPVAASAAPW